LKGHGFSRAVQVPQKSAGLYRLRKNSLIGIVLKGHGFSRAVKLPGNRAALAAEGCFSPLSRDSFGLFRTLFSPRGFFPQGRNHSHEFFRSLFRPCGHGFQPPQTLPQNIASPPLRIYLPADPISPLGWAIAKEET
jgi:hypothetical protein